MCQSVFCGVGKEAGSNRYLRKHFIRTKWQYFVCRSECVHSQPWPEQHGSEEVCERYKWPGDSNIPLLVLLASAQDSGQRSPGEWHHGHHGHCIIVHPRPLSSAQWTSLSMTRQVSTMKTVLWPSPVTKLPVSSMLLNYGASQKSNLASVDDGVCTITNTFQI